MRRLIGLVAFVVLLLPATALAQTTESFSFEIPERHIRATTGSTHDLGTFTVPAEFVGESCVVEAVADNNSSVHTNNDFTMSSGSASVTLPNVERGPGAVTRSTQELTLGSSIDVALFLGNVDNQNSGVFSGGFTINVICATQPEPTPTPTPTEPEPSPSPSPTETETEPPPDGEVESGGEVKSQTEVRPDGEVDDDSGALPFTGPALLGPLLWAAGLLGAGFSALWVARRK